MENYRVCPGCKTNLPLSAYGKKTGPKARKDGTRSRCKSCESEAYKVYRSQNLEAIRATKKRYIEKNKDKKSAWDKTYRAKNLDKLKAYQAEWQKANQDYIRAYRLNRTPEQIKAKKETDRIYSKNNPDKVREGSRRYRMNNPEQAAANAKKYRQSHRELMNSKAHKRRLKKRQNGIFKITEKELIALYNQNCFYCGSSERIELDHVIPIIRGGVHSVGNLVAACRKCNGSKGGLTIMEWRLKK